MPLFNTDKGFVQDVLGYTEEEIEKMSDSELSELASNALNDINTRLPTLEEMTNFSQEYIALESKPFGKFLHNLRIFSYDLGIIAGFKKTKLKNEEITKKFGAILKKRGPYYNFGRDFYMRLNDIINYFIEEDKKGKSNFLLYESNSASLLSRSYVNRSESCGRSAKRDKRYRDLADQIDKEKLAKNK